MYDMFYILFLKLDDHGFVKKKTTILLFFEDVALQEIVA